MTKIIHSVICPAAGFLSVEAATFFAQMEDQSKRLFDAIRGITPEELEWQPAPGMNSIGMLLAHMAACEVGWAQRALERVEMVDIDAFLVALAALGQEDDGIPLPPDGKPPAYLRGKDLTYYEDRLARARAYWCEAAAKITDADMDPEITQAGYGGSQRIFNVRWAMYHVLVHFPGHVGQILLLRHLYRAER